MKISLLGQAVEYFGMSIFAIGIVALLSLLVLGVVVAAIAVVANRKR